MAEAPQVPKEIVFCFETDKDYRTIATNGAWIGSTTRQDITIDFYIERLALPETVTHPVEEGGRLGAESGRTPERKFLRTFQLGVLLSAESAESVAKEILRRVEILKQSQMKK